jgi:hypothetical protein
VHLVVRSDLLVLDYLQHLLVLLHLRGRLLLEGLLDLLGLGYLVNQELLVRLLDL